MNLQAQNIEVFLQENKKLQKAYKQKEEEISNLKQLLEKQIKQNESLRSQKDLMATQISSIKNFLGQKIKCLLAIIGNQTSTDQSQLCNYDQLLQDENTSPIKLIENIFSLLEEKIVTQQQILWKKQINQRLDSMENKLIYQNESSIQFINKQTPKNQPDQFDQNGFSSIVKGKCKSFKNVTFQQDKLNEQKYEEIANTESCKSSSDEQDLLQTSIMKDSNAQQGNLQKNAHLGTYDILISPILKNKEGEQGHKQSQFFSFYEEDIKDNLTANNQNKSKNVLKNKDQSSQCNQNSLNHRLQFDQNELNKSLKDSGWSEKIDELNLKINQSETQIDKKVNKSKSFTISQQEDNTAKTKSKRNNSTTPTNRSRSFKLRQQQQQIQKKSQFWSQKQLLTQEEQDLEESDNSSKSNTDYLNLKNNPNFSNLINKNQTDNRSQEIQFLFSDKVIKHSKTGAQQEIIILLDQTYFYVFQNLDQINNFKKFFIKEINQINVSSKNNNRCCLSIKNEYQLLLETINTNSLINYILSVFTNILKINPPKLQSYSQQIEQPYSKESRIQKQQ